MTEQVKQVETKANQTRLNGTKPDVIKPDEVVTESTTRIPLSLVYARLADVLNGTPQGAKVEGDGVLAVKVEKREIVAK